MKFSDEGYPLVILSHRKREFIESTLASIREHAVGITDVIVVDDSGDRDHHEWLCDSGYQFSAVDVSRNAGYLPAMNRVWEVARDAAAAAGVDNVMLWEEDFLLVKPLSVFQMAAVMGQGRMLAHLNLQRQAVYRVERRYGYIQSHGRRGYGVVRQQTAGIPWVRRRRPFTTNPGLIRRDVLDVDWPSRAEADAVDGGAEPAMSLRLEAMGYHFGWLGVPNIPHTHHLGVQIKSGQGY